MIDRFRSEDWPMLPHSEPESYPDDWEHKPKILLPAPVLDKSHQVSDKSVELDAVKCDVREGEAQLAAGIQSK